MIQRVKRKIKKLIRPEPAKPLEPSIQFPGGLVPIHETQPQDVFIVGFPKSGNTLMQHIIAHLIYGINEEGSRTMVNLIAPDIYANTHYFRFHERCFFKSHERPKPQYRKVIYLIRDGRDALLSYYQMMKNLGREISLDELYTGKIPIFGGQWHEHIEAWEKNPFDAEVLWVRFEDLKNDKLEELRRVCTFLGIKRSDSDLGKVIAYSSLEHMKALETRSDWQRINEKKKFQKGKSFIGEGKVNSYSENISSDLLEIFENRNGKTLYKYY